MKAEFPMRVRCVNNTALFPSLHLVVGHEYIAHGRDGEFFRIDMGFGKERDLYFCERFKPVVRVKAKCVASLDLLLKRSARAVAAMSPEEYEEMMRKQRESYVRGEMALSATGLG